MAENSPREATLAQLPWSRWRARALTRGVTATLRVALGATLFTALSACFLLPGPDPVAEKQSRAEYDLARDLHSKGKGRAALERVLRALELDGQNEEAAYFTGFLYLELCQTEQPVDCRMAEAERWARRTLELKADHREGRNLLGLVLIHQHRAAEAVEVLTPLTQDLLYQSPALAWGNLGWAQLEAGKLGPAEESLRRALAAEPLYCVGAYRLGLVAERRGKAAAAEEAFTQAISTPHPDCARFPDAVAGRARTRLALGRRADAAADARKCLELATRGPLQAECRAILAKVE